MKSKTKSKIIFIGTSEFGAIVLKELCKTNYKPVLVITGPDKKSGGQQIFTSPPVKVMAERYEIPVFQLEKIKDAIHEIRKTRTALVLVARYEQILPKEILEVPNHGCLKIHPSLLPKYRGFSPIQSAILNREKETGVSIILIIPQMDAGPILAQNKTIIGPRETTKQLTPRLAKLGGKLLIDTIPDWLRGKTKLRSQDEKRASYTKILKKEDGKIDWKKSAEEIECQIRAFDPWPGSFTFWKDRELKILKAKVLKSKGSKTYPLGKTLVAPQNELCVQCGKEFLIIEKLQLEGKKPIDSEQFIRGHPKFIGTILK